MAKCSIKCLQKIELTASNFSEATMSEAELNTYKLQLQQVEAALTTDPDNEVSSTDI